MAEARRTALTRHLHYCCCIALFLAAALPAPTESRSVDYEYERSLDDDEDPDYPAQRLLHRMRRDEELGEPTDVQWLGLGVLSDMQQFFDNLKTNLDALETLPPEEKDNLLGKHPVVQERERHFRPSATAAYLHALRNQRPSYKIRNFVESPEPVSLRGTNRYDPSLLWTGLGKRKR